jgi:iron complex outermembrane receptor protein
LRVFVFSFLLVVCLGAWRANAQENPCPPAVSTRTGQPSSNQSSGSQSQAAQSSAGKSQTAQSQAGSPSASQPTQSPSPASSNCENEKLPVHKETIAVTGTFEPVPVQDIDRAISVIDTREYPLLYTYGVDYLQLNPSVDLQERAPGGVQADLTIRGSTFEQTLVLLNGLRMNDVQASHHNLDLPLPASAIERIEVLPGAGSIFYGSDAVAGTVNFITGPPRYSEAQAGAAIGNFGTNQETLSAGFVANHMDEQLSVARDFSTGFMPDRDYRSLTIFANTGVETALGRSLVMLGLGDKPFGANQFYGLYESWERTKSWFGGLKQDLGPKTEFDFGYRRHTDEFILVRDDPSLYENNHIDQSWQGAIRRTEKIGQNSSLFFGGEGFYDGIRSNNLGDHHRTHSAGYIDYDARALGRFSLSAGVREEVFDTNGQQFIPSLSAGMLLKPGWKLQASVGRAFRLPTYTDLYYSDPVHIPNPNLLPETAWSYEGGLVWDQGGRYQAKVTVFERQVKNDIDYVRPVSPPPPAQPAPWQAENLGHVNFTGVEASFDVRLKNQRIDVAYTGLYGVQNALGNLQSLYVFNYPSNDAVVTWQGKLPGNFVARSRLGVVKRYPSDPYALWDASVGREFRNVSAHLAFANLTNTGYQEIQGVAMPGRSVVFGMDVFVRKKR